MPDFRKQKAPTVCGNCLKKISMTLVKVRASKGITYQANPNRFVQSSHIAHGGRERWDSVWIKYFSQHQSQSSGPAKEKAVSTLP